MGTLEEKTEHLAEPELPRKSSLQCSLHQEAEKQVVLPEVTRNSAAEKDNITKIPRGKSVTVNHLITEDLHCQKVRAMSITSKGKHL